MVDIQKGNTDICDITYFYLELWSQKQVPFGKKDMLSGYLINMGLCYFFFLIIRPSSVWLYNYTGDYEFVYAI